MPDKIKTVTQEALVERYGNRVVIGSLSELDIHWDRHFVIRIELTDEKAIIESCVVDIPFSAVTDGPLPESQALDTFDSCDFVAAHFYSDPRFIDQLLDTIDTEFQEISAAHNKVERDGKSPSDGSS